jgi:long-chain acyl-CoA synthetase
MTELLDETIYGSFEEVAKRFPDKVALIYLGEKYNYSELKEMVDRFAASLHELGTKQGDRVILYLYNMPQTIIAWLALQRLGAIAILVAPVYTARDLKYLANDGGAETIVCMDTNFSYVGEILPETPLTRVIVTSMIDLVPWWKKVIGRGFDRVPKGKTAVGKEFLSFTDLLKKGVPSSLPQFRADPAEPAVLLYTGGTTGIPKGVVITGALVLDQALEWVKGAEAVVPLGEGVSVLAAPLYHVIGQMEATGPLLVSAEPVVVLPRVVLDGMFDHIQRYKITRFCAVPAMFRMILEHDRVDYYDLSSLTYCLSGGDVLPAEVAGRWFRKFKKPLYQAYGSTEFAGCSTLCYSRDGVPPEGAVGKVIAGIDYKLVDPDTLEPVPPGAQGEFLGTSSHAIKSYWNKPEETAQCFVNLDGLSWYRTRDVLRVDEDGWFYFQDRSVDMIKHKGYRIAAAEIEKALQEHHAVLSASVVGVPDEKVGERIKAFVVLKEDIRGISSYELMGWCRERLAPYKVPQYIEFRDMLPKSKVGKFLRRELRDEETRKVEEE